MADDKPHLHVEFFYQPQEDANASRKEGRPIFRDVEMVKIQIVGDRGNNLIAPAHSSPSRDPDTGLPQTYAEKFPEHYRYFKANADQQAAGGTPLTEVPWLTASKREELKALKIYTVEGLAGLDGTLLNRIGMGARELKNQAQAWLDRAAGSAVDSRMAAELAAKDEAIATLQRQMEEMQRMMKPFDGDDNGAPGGSVSRETEDDTTNSSPFSGWEAEDIKNWIKDATGSRPPGNPSLKTLIARADEINAELAQKAA